MLGPRFRLRTLMLGVVVMATLIGTERVLRRRAAYLERAQRYAKLEAWFSRSAEGWAPGQATSPGVAEFYRGVAARYGRLRAKYERASACPWLAVEPDPPIRERPRIAMRDGVALVPTQEDLVYIDSRGLASEFAGWTPLQRSIYLIALDGSRPMSEIGLELGVEPAIISRAIQELSGTLLWDRSRADPEVSCRD
jgi:hypothetical protein